MLPRGVGRSLAVQHEEGPLWRIYKSGLFDRAVVQLPTFLLEIDLVSAVSLRSDSFFSDPADAVFSVARQECSGRVLTIGFTFARADYLDLHVG